MILEIQNPSDAVTIIADDITAAGVAVMLLSSWYGLEDEQGESVVPITGLGGQEEWLKEHGIEDVDKYIQENGEKLTEIFESCLYGHPSDRRLFDSAIAKMSFDDAKKFREEWNEQKRSSTNNIGAACQAYADIYRKKSNTK